MRRELNPTLITDTEDSARKAVELSRRIAEGLSREAAEDDKEWKWLILAEVLMLQDVMVMVWRRHGREGARLVKDNWIESFRELYRHLPTTITDEDDFPLDGEVFQAMDTLADYRDIYIHFKPKASKLPIKKEEVVHVSLSCLSLLRFLALEAPQSSQWVEGVDPQFIEEAVSSIEENLKNALDLL